MNKFTTFSAELTGSNDLDTTPTLKFSSGDFMTAGEAERYFVTQLSDFDFSDSYNAADEVSLILISDGEEVFAERTVVRSAASDSVANITEINVCIAMFSDSRDGCEQSENETLAADSIREKLQNRHPNALINIYMNQMATGVTLYGDYTQDDVDSTYAYLIELRGEECDFCMSEEPKLYDEYA